MKLDGWIGRKDLGGDEREETMLEIYSIKNYFQLKISDYKKRNKMVFFG